MQELFGLCTPTDTEIGIDLSSVKEMGPNPQVKDIFDADYFEQVIFNENGQMFVYTKQGCQL